MSIEGVHIVRSARPGKPIRWYVYAWRGGPCVLKVTSPTRPKITRAVAIAVAAEIEKARAVPADTLLALARDWRSLDPAKPSSPEWDDLGDGTKKTWGGHLDLIEAKWGDLPLAVWNDAKMVGKVIEWRDRRKKTPRSADIGVTVLRRLLEYGRLRGRVTINVADNIPTLYRGGDRAEIIWTEDDITHFCAMAEQVRRRTAADAVRLMAVTGLRRQDIVSLTWAQVGEFAIVKRALKRSQKKRRFATMPRIAELDTLLAELRTRKRQPGVETVLVNSRGKSWTGDGLGSSFDDVQRKAQIMHVDDETGERRKKHLHDVRGTYATRLCLETDLTDAELADIMAWEPTRVGNIRRMYVDQSSIVVAIGERIAAGRVKRSVKRSEDEK